MDFKELEFKTSCGLRKMWRLPDYFVYTGGKEIYEKTILDFDLKQGEITDSFPPLVPMWNNHHKDNDKDLERFIVGFTNPNCDELYNKY